MYGTHGTHGTKGADGTHWIHETYEQIGFLGLGLIYKIIIPFLEKKNRFGKGIYLFYNQ